MDEHLPFLRAIAADPADDLPRLVFADYLEETGEPDHVARAHFIRAQIALEQLPPKTRDFYKTRDLQDRLFDMYRSDWIWDIPSDLQTDGRPIYRRGFIEFLRLPWHVFVEATDLFATVPITRVQITAVRRGPRSADAIDGASHIPRITHLHVDHLSSLSFNGSPSRFGVIPGLIPILLNSQNFSGLTLLNMSGNSIETPMLVQFILRYEDTSFATSLKELDLSDIPAIDDAVGNALATARGLESLERLILKRTELSEPVRAMLRRRFGERVVF